MTNTLRLSTRQLSMLEEMGIRVFSPQPQKIPTSTDETPNARPPVSVAHAPRQALPATTNTTASRTPSNSTERVLQPLPQGIAQMDWSSLQSAVASCQSCALCHERIQPVFGTDGASPSSSPLRQAGWLVVGEAPSEDEELLGEPFVGDAGQLFDNMLKALGLSRQSTDNDNDNDSVYITNALKCRPPHHRNPSAEEIQRCETFLKRQVTLLRPKVILALGRVAAQSLLQSTDPIGKLRGQVHRYLDIPVIVTYHPAYLLRSPSAKAKAWDDLCLAQRTITTPPTA